MGRSAEAATYARTAALASAFLSGAAGLGLQSLVVSACGLALGYGASLALGLSLWIAAWALGAWCARDPRIGGARGLRAAGLASFGLAPLATWGVIAAGGAPGARSVAVAVALAALALPAWLQGVFLPALARSGARVGALFGANLLGCVGGAWWIADFASGAWGRIPAAWIAGGTAGVAGVLGAHALVRAGTPRSAVPAVSSAVVPWRAVAVVAFGTAWMSALEWVSLRLGVLWFGGMQNALTAVLCASLFALALGAWILPVLLQRSRHALVWLLWLAVAGSSWPFLAAHVLASARDQALPLRALALCGPTLFAFGALVPLAHARAGADEHADAGGRLGRLLLGEVLGAALGIPLVQWFVVPQFGLPAAVSVALLCGTVALACVSRLAWVPALVAACVAVRAPTPARQSAPYANPAFRVLALTEDRDFAVGVVDDGLVGERTLLTDGFRAAGTGRDYLYMQALGHLPILLHPAPRRVAVLALGTGTTVGAVSLHPEVERIDVLELSRAVVEAAPSFVEKNHGALAEGLPGLLDDADGKARVVVRLGDGRATLARSPGAYDVLTMEPLLPDSPFAVYLYTREFYAVARRALRPGGLVCQWVPPHALEPATFEAVCGAFAASFPWSAAWLFGTQVVLVGGEREPRADAARFEGLPSELRSELGALGLSSPADLVVRCVAPGLPAPLGARELTDADPWIAYRPRRRGPQLLADLPANLERLAGAATDERVVLGLALDAPTRTRIEGRRALLRARVALCDREAVLDGVTRVGSQEAQLDPRLAAARAGLGDDPELRRFEAEEEFLTVRRAGLTALSAGTGRVGAAVALEPLVRAAELRGERADVHLYAALALERLESPAADKALTEALSRCPRLAETDAGTTAARLGISPRAWQRMLASARPRP